VRRNNGELDQLRNFGAELDMGLVSGGGNVRSRPAPAAAAAR
jgi:hypothetical protein